MRNNLYLEQIFKFCLHWFGFACFSIRVQWLPTRIYTIRIAHWSNIEFGCPKYRCTPAKKKEKKHVGDNNATTCDCHCCTQCLFIAAHGEIRSTLNGVFCGEFKLERCKLMQSAVFGEAKVSFPVREHICFFRSIVGESLSGLDFEYKQWA